MTDTHLERTTASEMATTATPYVAGAFSIGALGIVIQLAWAGWVGGAWPPELSWDQAGALAVLVAWAWTRIPAWSWRKPVTAIVEVPTTPVPEVPWVDRKGLR